MNGDRQAPAQPDTISQAECYQRLRAHLAFLKLPDAAEALPRLLDEARASKLPVIETLEALPVSYTHLTLPTIYSV